MRNKQVGLATIIFILVFSLIGCSSPKSYFSDYEKAREEEFQQEREIRSAELENLASKSGVDHAIIIPDGFSPDDFTINLNSEFQGKNIVLYLYVSDIYESNGKTYALLYSNPFLFFEHYIFVLECSNETIESLFDNGLTYNSFSVHWDRVKVIANVENITPMRYTVKTSGSLEEGYRIYLNNDTPIVEIKGKCIAMEMANR